MTTPVQLPVLPSLEPGVGNRRDDCYRYDDCLTRWARSQVTQSKLPIHQAARCPDGCASFAKADKTADIAAATVRKGLPWVA